MTFEPNKEYVREVLSAQYDLRTDGLEYVPLDDLPGDHTYFRYQKTVNVGGAPSELVIDETRRKVTAITGMKPRARTRSPNCARWCRRNAEEQTVVLTPTKADGAVSQASPVLYVEPDRQVTSETLETMFAGSALNAPFVSIC